MTITFYYLINTCIKLFEKLYFSNANQKLNTTNDLLRNVLESLRQKSFEIGQEVFFYYLIYLLKIMINFNNFFNKYKIYDNEISPIKLDVFQTPMIFNERY